MIQTEKQYQFLYLITRLYIENTLVRLNVHDDQASLPHPAAANSYLTSTPKAVSLQSINTAISMQGASADNRNKPK